MKQAICELCDMPAIKSSIIGDIYYRHLCMACYDRLMTPHKPSSGEAAYNRGRDLEEHEADIMQPMAGGKLSPEFVHLYPEQARKMFSDDEIDQATRS